MQQGIRNVRFGNLLIMGYFNYHAVAKNMIKNQKLLSYEILEIDGRFVLFLYFDDIKHQTMKIKSERIPEYLPLIEKNRK